MRAGEERACVHICVPCEWLKKIRANKGGEGCGGICVDFKDTDV